MYLLRHGQSEFNVIYGKTRRDPGIRDPKLTPLGKEQAINAAKSLEDLDIHKILCSPYRRAIETASIVSYHLKVDIKALPIIGEHAMFKCDIGSPVSHLKKDFPHVDFSEVCPENWWPDTEEKTKSLNHRCSEFRRLAKDYKTNTVAVTHWGFIRYLTNIRSQNCGIIKFDALSEQPGGGTVVYGCDTC